MTVQHIRPRKGLRSLSWTELWHSRDLVALLVRRDFVVKYKQTLLGPLWFVIQPLGLAVVLWFGVNKGAGVKTGDVHPFLFNLCSLAPWFYFAQTFQTVAMTFVSHVDLFRKVYFPRAVVPLAAALSNLIPLAIQVILVFGVAVGFATFGHRLALSWSIVFLPLLFAELFLFALGAGLCAAALTATYRDLAHAIQYLVLLLMFGSLVFIPRSQLPPDLWWIIWVNPVATIIEGTRAAMFGLEAPPLPAILLSWLVTAVVLLVGLSAFETATTRATDRG